MSSTSQQPAGWVMVPVEPTEEMKAAAVKYANGEVVYKRVSVEVLRVEEGIYGEIYEAMLAAAPKVAQPAPPPAAPADSDDSLLLCASDLQHSAIYDNHVEMQSCMRAVAERITALATQPQQAAPFLWVSPEQAETHTDPDDASGGYLPARKTSAGKFTMALYAAPPQEVTPSQGADDAARLRVVIDLLRDALDPLEVSAAAIESDDAEQLDGLIDCITRVLDQYDAERVKQERQ